MEKRKGSRAEREIVRLLAAVMEAVEKAAPVAVYPHSENVRRSGIQLFRPGEDILGVPLRAIEVKCQTRLHVAAWWEQCLSQAPGRRFPVLFYKTNRKWRVRSFATLLANGLVDTAHQIVAEYDIAAFLSWYAESYREWLPRPSQAACEMQ